MEYLSKERYDQITAELENLIKVEFPRLTQELADARAQGDLSENFEYHACKRAQGKMMGRIRFLQRVLQYAKVIDPTLLNSDTVGLFRKVTVTNIKSNAQRTYTIVNPHEADLTIGKLSIKSPIGHALDKHQIGDVVDVPVPAGTIQLRIDAIEVA